MTIRPRHHILHLTDGNRGGSQRHVIDLCRADSADFRHFILRITPDAIGLHDVDGDRLLVLDPQRIEQGWPALLPRLVAELGISCIHAHALLPLLALLETGDESVAAARCCVTLHDLRCIDPDFFAHPRAELSPDPAWIARCEKALRRVGAVIVPSNWLAQIVHRHYPGLTPHIIENGIASPVGADSPVETAWPSSRSVYAVVGAVGAHKGRETLMRVAAAITDPDIVGVLIGYTDAQETAGWSIPGKLYVHGRYQPDELHGLLRGYGCRLAYFPNIVPESFSYVLSEVWQAGIPALVPAVGALGERVQASGAGWLLSDPLDAAKAAATITGLLAPEAVDQLAAARRVLETPSRLVAGVESMRGALERVYEALGAKTTPAVDAGWTHLTSLTRPARFDGIDDGLLDAQWASLVREEHSLRQWNTKLVHDIAALEANAQRMQSHFEEGVNRSRRLDAEILKLKARNDRVESDAAALRERSAQLETNFAEIAALGRDVEMLQARNRDLEQHVVALRERNTQVERDVTALVGRNVQLEGDVVALTQRNIELDSSIVALLGRNTQIESWLEAVKQRNTRVEVDAATLQSELERTREGQADLERELSVRAARISMLERGLGMLPSVMQNWLLRHAR
ncbi:MAG: glycosyltransferase [Betaproteobacteria bacterium]